jgi:AMP phosphorylase
VVWLFLKARLLELEAKKPIVILNKEDAEELGVKALDRVELDPDGKEVIAIVNVAEKFISKGEIGLYDSVQDQLNVKEGKKIDVNPAEAPESLSFIVKKLAGKDLRSLEIRKIVEDVVKHRLSEIEITAFITSLHIHGLTMNEAAYLSTHMATTGDILRLKNKEIYDKHSIGGIPGDKTTLLVVPMVAVAGLTIPKTSSRAITSPAGTADRVECLCPVDLELEEIKKVIEKTNACMVWGGAVDLAPADDVFIQVEYPLSIDPLLLPSVMSKKKAVQAKYIVIDMPTGKGTKMKTISDYQELAAQFIGLGKKLGINVACASTFGEQPIGYAIGPALEAREALETIMRGKGISDLIDKAVNLASILFDFKHLKNSKTYALKLLTSGKVEKKFREIIEAQGGNPSIKPGDLSVGSKTIEIKSNASGKVFWINNAAIAQIARAAGAPKDKGAGILLSKKIGDSVKGGETLFKIYAEKNYKLNRALRIANELDVIGIGKKLEMLLAKIPEEKEHKKYFILER